MSLKSKIVFAAKGIGRKISANSPTIMVVAGTVGLVIAGVIAAKKSATELNGILEEHKEAKQKLKDIRDGVVEIPEMTAEEYADKKYKKHLTALYIRTGKKLVKVYGPALVLAILSVVSIFGGHKILTKRHLAAIAESYAVKETLDEYRKRVKGKLGDEAEELLFANAEKEIVTDEIKDPETGEVKRESAEVLHGPATKGIYRYICSQETMKPHAWYNFETRQVQYLTASVLQIANDHMEDHEYLILKDIMQHNWKDSYIKEHDEIFNAGWWWKNPFAKPLDLVHPIDMQVKKISGEGEEPKYEVIFNCQGDIVNAMRLAKAQNREEKLNARKKPRGHYRAATA